MSSNLAFVLGAGASRAAGAPLMSDFFERAKQLKREGKLGDANADYDRVHAFRSELQRTAAKANLDLDNLEVVFGALEMAAVLGRMGSIGASEADAIRESFERLIGATIEGCMEFPTEGRAEHKRLCVPRGYQEFVSTIRSKIERFRGRRLGFVTFNYDIGLDFALYSHNLPFSYGLQPHQEQLGLYKLHGSLNWLKDKEDIIRVAGFPDQYDIMRQIALTDRRTLRLSMAGGLKALANKYAVAPRPYIVAPTDSKLEHRRQIAPVWQAAAELLSTASTIVVVGFSFPRTDDFFRHFFAVGSVSDTFIERFVVIDPNEGVKERLMGLLSPAVQRRFEWWDGKLEDKIPLLNKLLEQV